jgi:MYXO-CTERM domain-containing protein
VSQASQPGFEWIERVTLNGDTVTSGSSALTTHPGIFTTLETSRTYSLTVDIVLPPDEAQYCPKQELLTVWLDENGDDAFTGPGEMVVLRDATSPDLACEQSYSFSAALPLGVRAAGLQTGMRIQLKFANFGGSPGPCDVSFAGEVEHFTVELLATKGSIGVRVFDDLNANGGDDDEPGIPGVTLALHEDLDADGFVDSNEPSIGSTESGETGVGVFPPVAPGDYLVVVDSGVPGAYEPTTEVVRPVTVLPGGADSVAFGFALGFEMVDDAGCPDAGCSDAGCSDAGCSDAGNDAGTGTSGAMDGGEWDSGDDDGGVPDSGEQGDSDAGESDGGPGDSGSADGGQVDHADAGERDAGSMDVGPPDGGSAVGTEAGVPDAGGANPGGDDAGSRPPNDNDGGDGEVSGSDGGTVDDGVSDAGVGADEDDAEAPGCSCRAGGEAPTFGFAALGALMLAAIGRRRRPIARDRR